MEEGEKRDLVRYSTMLMSDEMLAFVSAYCNSTDTLNLAHNRFDGSFPPEWTEMSSLKHLDVSNNE